MKVLVTFATKYGSTEEVSDYISKTLEKQDIQVEKKKAKQVTSIEDYDVIILGAPLIMFHWHKDAHNFIIKHKKNLSDKKIFLFALGPTHVPYDEKEWQDSNNQLNNELSRYSWLRPVDIQLFGGKFDLSNLSFLLKWLAGKVNSTDIRDWNEIYAWSINISKKLLP